MSLQRLHIKNGVGRMTRKVEKRMFRKKKKLCYRRCTVTCGPLSSDSELYVISFIYIHNTLYTADVWFAISASHLITIQDIKFTLIWLQRHNPAGQWCGAPNPAQTFHAEFKGKKQKSSGGARPFKRNGKY